MQVVINSSTMSCNSYGSLWTFLTWIDDFDIYTGIFVERGVIFGGELRQKSDLILSRAVAQMY